MQSVRTSLLAAFRYLLKPLVRIAVTNGVLFPDFSDALKKAFVDVAVRQMMASKMDVSEEGISLIASIEVQEVGSILRGGTDAQYGQVAHQVSPLEKILSAWHTDARYTGPYGVLRDLHFSSNGSQGSDPDGLVELVQTYFPDIKPQVAVDELVRIGAVQDLGKGFYRAVKRSYVPEPLSVPSIRHLARVMHNLSETLEVNLRPASADGKGLIERSIYAGYGIPKQDLPAFDTFIRARGQIFADDIDNWITDRDVEGIKNGIRIGVGFYHYVVNEDDEISLSKDLQN